MSSSPTLGQHDMAPQPGGRATLGLSDAPGRVALRLERADAAQRSRQARTATASGLDSGGGGPTIDVIGFGSLPACVLA